MDLPASTLDHLQWDWNTKGLNPASLKTDPRALITFGIFAGRDEILYMGELY